MKWLVLILLFSQKGCVWSCIFEKVEHLKCVTLNTLEINNINVCYTACYENVRCIGFQHWKTKPEKCNLLTPGDGEHVTKKDGTAVVYKLLRDDVDPTCQTFVNI